MKKVDDKKLEKVIGGFSVWIGIGIAALVIFASGVIDGIVNPSKCG